MRKKPAQNGGYSNQRQRPRFNGGGGGGGEHRSNGGGHGGGGNRPRRNYGAAREKYLAQARDALAAGDRVLAENYLQHADHCYRMMVEEGAFKPREQRPANAPQEDGQQANHQGGNEMPENDFPENTSQLPAFLTASYEQPQQAKPVEQPVQDWEERDAN